MIALPIILAAAPMAPIATIPRRAGQCSWVRGRFTIANGSSLNRLWVIGTGHVLALRDDDQKAPPAVWRMWNKPNPFAYELWGEFHVCARERWISGHMQHVRINATRNTLLRRR
ncbi:hypothetical protein [Sphingomonas pruni]|uniref:hypothetical protein n=1 Tax=Sphingomonas pruni TaxID=40683 RepID=UPI0012EDC350|nr:hypothetical protein [Sphingomonas pruni]